MKTAVFDLKIDHPDIINEGILEDEKKIVQLAIYRDIRDSVKNVKKLGDLKPVMRFEDKSEGTGASMPIVVVEFLSGKYMTALANTTALVEVGKVIFKIIKKLLRKYSGNLEVGIKTAELLAKLEVIKRNAIIGDPCIAFRRHCACLSNEGFKLEYYFIINGDSSNKKIFSDSAFVSIGGDGKVKGFHKF